jgi:hypothetical protein
MKTAEKIALVLLLAMSYLTNAQETFLITDRPDQTESSSVIPRGSIQIESGTMLEFTDASGETVKQITIPTTLFRLGITNSIELRIFNQYEILKNLDTGDKTNGISDIEVGVKIQIFQKESVNTEVAFLSHLIIPTGSKALTNKKYGTINKLSVSHNLFENYSLGYNLGYNYYGEGNGNFTYSVALGHRFTDKISLYIEPYGEIVECNTHVMNTDAGITYVLKPNFQLDFSFGTGLNQTMNYFSTGFSWNISNLK